MSKRRTMEARRALLRAIFDAAVAAAHPRHGLQAHLPEPPAGRIIVLAAGKAAAAMAAVAEEHYRNIGLAPRRLSGLAATRRGHGVPLRHIELIEAGHPMPNAQSEAAAAMALANARRAETGDLVLALLSGGGSANWMAPVEGVSVAQKQTVTRQLLVSGAPIGAINAVRKHISRIKGGKLAVAARPARVVTLAISDVANDDPSVIASGPTVPDATTLADARAVLRDHAITTEAAITRALNDPANETPKPEDPVFANSEFRIIARARDALDAAAETARRAGYHVIDLGAALEGEAREAGLRHGAIALEAARTGKPAAIVSGGELTVTVRGKGRGGPNQEYALALALALRSQPELAARISALAADTDGNDGGSGAITDPAGAFVDGEVIARMASSPADAADALANNDSTAFFETTGGSFVSGPTMTNVNDLRVILVEP
jgi:hydroxypyruvate reductase